MKEKKLLIVFFILASLILCPIKSIYAQKNNDPYGEMKIPIPEGTNHVIDGQQGIFFTLEEYKQIANIYNQYVIRVPRRDELIAYLQEKNIGCAIYYPRPMHLQECFEYLGYKEGDFPEAEKAAKEVAAIPIYPELTDEMKEYVVNTILDFYRQDDK